MVPEPDRHAADIVARLGLIPHPEGGFYRETHREPDPAGGRARSTAILSLLPAGGRSHWHRVDATEIWLHHAGHPLRLCIGDRVVMLGADVTAMQAIVPAGVWQSAEAGLGWSLVSCVVTPGFEFDGFELAPPDWSPPRSRAKLRPGRTTP